MTDRVVRPLEAAEQRAAYTLFRNALHLQSVTDEQWERAQRSFQPGLTLGAFDGDALIGTARYFDAELTVPGGGAVPVAAVTGVGVRADRTRRGVLRDLMRRQLEDVASLGIPLAALHASEGPIYGRFGYGIATRHRSLRVDRRRARVLDTAPTGGEIELHGLESALRVLPELYGAFPGVRAGMITRPTAVWPMWEGHYRRSSGLPMLAVHRGQDGVDGYAMYRVVSDLAGSSPAVMYIEDMCTSSHEGFADLWRYLLGVDLVDQLEAPWRPLDEPLDLLLTDPRACTTTGVGDDVWVRLVDVAAALSARSYKGPGRVVFEVWDAVLPGNAGCYEVSADGVRRTDDAAQLRGDVSAIAQLYLGAWSVPQLVAVGQLEAVDPLAVHHADRLLVTDRQPWCGTFF